MRRGASKDYRLCRHCDLYVGWWGVLVMSPPSFEPEWLESHCWGCKRSLAEVIEENERRAESGKS